MINIMPLNINFNRVFSLKVNYENHRWAHTASPLISEANFFISALAVLLTSQDVNGLVIEAKFFLTNPLENNCFNRGFSNTSTKIYHIRPYLKGN